MIRQAEAAALAQAASAGHQQALEAMERLMAEKDANRDQLVAIMQLKGNVTYHPDVVRTVLLIVKNTSPVKVGHDHTVKNCLNPHPLADNVEFVPTITFISILKLPALRRI